MTTHYSFQAAKKLAEKQLKEASQSPSVDADYLLCEYTGVERSQIPLKLEENLTQEQWDKFCAGVERRAGGEPLAYIVGHWGFWKYDFIVTKDTLVPRVETETMVDAVLARYSNEYALQVLEMGVGSGVVSVCLGKNRPNWEITATDICPKALAVAKLNAEKHNVTNIQNFFQGSWYDALPEQRYFDLIVSNPPYVYEEAPHLKTSGLRFEPKKALVGGVDGSELAVQVIRGAAKWLYPGGYLMLESASTHIEKIKGAMASVGIKYVESVKDISNRERVSIGQLPPE